ncbi:MAG: ATP-binding protein [Spirochaetota bacterium]
MSREQVDRLFRTDERLQQPGTDGESGNGLGLLLLHDLVTRMSGAVEVESTPDEGSVFTVRLPSSAIADQ